MGNDAEIDKVKRKNNLCLNLVKVIWHGIETLPLLLKPVFQFILEIKCLKFKMK